MIHIRSKASSLATLVVRPNTIAAVSLKTSRHGSREITNPRKYFSRLSSARPFRQQPQKVISLTRNQQNIRHCSCQRIMCKAETEMTGGGMDVTKSREVLPTNVKPLHYDLTLEPDLEKFVYEGSVIIE